MIHLIAEHALLEGGFAAAVRIGIQDGWIVSVTQGAAGQPGDEAVRGALLPGMTDIHSHAFQRAFAGTTEYAAGGTDFWLWRERMYRFAASMDPHRMAHVAAYLGMELLKGGYTGLIEFHYLQNDPQGRRYDPQSAMADAITRGAHQAGIALTLLFGIYETGGFDNARLQGGQIMFRNTADQAMAMLTAALPRATPDLRFGLAPHSLRAVPPSALAAAVSAAAALDPATPIHIHVAEQMGEVRACQASLGARPVSWLLDHAPVGRNWCLIHATHATPAELQGVARTQAAIGLCPTTEGNLGDGIFPLPDFMQAGGVFGIGSDSNVALDAFGELRLLEYGQRLAGQRRNVGTGRHAHTGQALWHMAAQAGAGVSGRLAGGIAVGRRADFVVIEPTAETMHGAGPELLLDAAMFAALTPVARHVMVGGNWLVRDGMHAREAEITHAYGLALKGCRL
jgi:formimidoylglutamate deiminase